jgi:hypothetical protein
MAFQARVNQLLRIDEVSHYIVEHPSVPGMPYGQEGRQAIVYQLASDLGKRALKVFKSRFITPSSVTLADHLATLAHLPGLQVCQRVVLTPQRHASLLREYPDLTYAVVMPWVDGPTWTEMMLNKNTTSHPSLTPDQSLMFARACAHVLSTMEQRAVAHCDISGSNMLLPALVISYRPNDLSPIALVDVEELYAPNLERPRKLPAGSQGYAHKTSPDGLWSAEADRFAGAVLIAEILGWCDSQVRGSAWGESYFDPEEIQKDTERYQNILRVLRGRWGGRVAELFDRAWRSETLTECATFGEWLATLPGSDADRAFPIRAGTGAEVDRLIVLAQQRESRGDLSGAVAVYRNAIAHLPTRTPMHDELLTIVENLEKRQRIQDQVNEMASQAELLAQNGRWREAATAYRTVMAHASQSPQLEAWRAALQKCEEEARLAQLFDGGVDALARHEWSTAQELLGQVVLQRPTYARKGRRATTLVEESHRGATKPNAMPLLPWLLLGVAIFIGLLITVSAILLLLAVAPLQPTASDAERAANTSPLLTATQVGSALAEVKSVTAVPFPSSIYTPVPVQTLAPTPVFDVNLVPNGSFETVNSGWTPRNYAWPSITMQWTTDWAKSGAHSVMIGDLPAADSSTMPTANWVSGFIRVEPNSAYIAGFSYCSINGQIVQWSVTAYDSSHQQLGQTTAGGATSSNPNCNGEMRSEFMPGELRNGTNPRVEYVTINIGVTNPPNSPRALGPTYFDDVYLYKK